MGGLFGVSVQPAKVKPSFEKPLELARVIMSSVEYSLPSTGASPTPPLML